MRKSKGMTLIEMLIAMGISALIMAATFVIVRYSANTYDRTADMIWENNNTHDTVNIINRYIRMSSFCSISDDGNDLYLYVDTDADGVKESVRFAYDEDDGMLVIDKMNGSERLTVSEGISRIDWETIHNGIKYRLQERKAFCFSVMRPKEDGEK